MALAPTCWSAMNSPLFLSLFLQSYNMVRIAVHTRGTVAIPGSIGSSQTCHRCMYRPRSFVGIDWDHLEWW